MNERGIFWGQNLLFVCLTTEKKAMLPVFTGLVKEGGAKVTQEIGFLEGLVLLDIFGQYTVIVSK